MEVVDFGKGSLSDAHRSAGATAHRALSADGASVDASIDGRAFHLLFQSGLKVSLVDMTNHVAVSETVAPASGQLVFLLKGGPCRQTIDGHPLSVRPGDAVLFVSDRSYLARVEVEPGQSYRFVSIGFSDRLLSDFGPLDGSDDPLCRLFDRSRSGPIAEVGSLGPELVSIAEALFGCSSVGPCGALLAEARALELTARTAQIFAGSGANVDPQSGGLRLSAADIERLHEAKRIVETEIGEAQTLGALSRRVGINVNKLKAGFKALFDVTVTEHAIRARLAYAHDLLATSDLPVSSVAYRVGYNPAHFAIAFRRRYGTQPSEVARRRGLARRDLSAG